MLDPATGIVVFTPVFGFAGTPPTVDYRVTDRYGQTGDGTYAPAVVPPAPPAAPAETSTGVGTTPQRAGVTVPTGGSVTLLDTDGDPATSVTIPGQGTYTVDPATGTLTFTPAPGFTGTVAPVTYRVTDAYGQSTDGSYTATVAAPPAPPVPGLPVTGGDPTGLVLLAAGLLLGGAALVLAARRRPTDARAHGLA